MIFQFFTVDFMVGWVRVFPQFQEFGFDALTFVGITALDEFDDAPV